MRQNLFPGDVKRPAGCHEENTMDTFQTSTPTSSHHQRNKAQSRPDQAWTCRAQINAGTNHRPFRGFRRLKAIFTLIPHHPYGMNDDLRQEGLTDHPWNSRGSVPNSQSERPRLPCHMENGETTARQCSSLGLQDNKPVIVTRRPQRIARRRSTQTM